MKASIFVVLCYILVAKAGVGQSTADTTRQYRIETTDGNEYFGIILQNDSIFVRFATSNIGTITIQKKHIIKIEDINKEQIIEGEVWYENLQATRYFWSPNGYGLKKGEGYYQNIWVMYNQAGIGFSNYFSLGAGCVPLFLFAGASTPVWIVPKFSVPLIKNRLNMGIGAMAGAVVGEDSSAFGIAYGVLSFGPRDHTFTLGIGYGWAGYEWTNHPIITLSGMLRVGKRGYLLTENYFMQFGNERITLVMLGGRAIIRKSGLDFGLVMPFFDEMDDMVAIPWLGITVPLQRK